MCCYIISSDSYPLSSLSPTYSPYPPTSPPTYPSSRLPGKTSSYWYHHLFIVCNIRFISVYRHRSIMGQAYMYCATVLCCLEIYAPIYSSPSTFITSPNVGYSHVPSICRRGVLPKICQANLWCNPPKIRLMRGFTTHVFNQTVGWPGQPRR